MSTSTVPPVVAFDTISGTNIELRRWKPEHAELLSELAAANIEHLRPWMPWIADEPLPLDERRRLISSWGLQWQERQDDLNFGIFIDGTAAGGCGMHWRIGPNGIELGYWTDHRRTRSGVASSAASLLVDTAFSIDGVERVEIHHDKANVASEGVPRTLGFEFVTEQPDGIEAPGEVGVERIWRMTKDQWRGNRRPH